MQWDLYSIKVHTSFFTKDQQVQQQLKSDFYRQLLFQLSLLFHYLPPMNIFKQQIQSLT